MKFKELHLINFKNLLDVTINLDADVNCFSGNNGEGKTNVLDAIRYLSMCKSYFNSVDYQNVNFNEDSFMVKGLIEKNEENDTLVCTVRKSAKKIFKRNSKDYQRLSDHIGLYPSIHEIDIQRKLQKAKSKTDSRIWLAIGFGALIISFFILRNSFRIIRETLRLKKPKEEEEEWIEY